MIKLKNINHSYGQKENSLTNFNINIKKGEYISIIGPNGSGKSTLALIISGIINDFEGEFLIDGIEATQEIIRNKIGILFQNPDNQLVSSIVKNDIAFGLENKNIPREQMDEIIDKALNTVDMIKYKELPIATLSGGEKQKIAFAGILALDFDVIILDEVTSMLDEDSAKEIMSLVDKEHKKGKTIILISHQEDIYNKSTRVVNIHENRS